MKLTAKRLATAATLVVLGLGIGRAAMQKFREKEQEIRRVCRDEAQKTGLSGAPLKAKYPTPEISMVSSGCLLPNSSAEVVIKGKFPPGTKFVFENDNLEVLKETLTANEYRATIKAPDGIGPQTAAVMAISPVSCITARKDRAVTVGGKYEFTLNASNGWRVVARSPAAKACPDAAGEDVYEMKFYRKDEAKEFESRKATLHFTVYEQTNFRFSMSQESAAAGSAQAEMMELMKKVSDPKLTEAQRDQAMKRIEAVQQRVMAEMQQMSDPSYIKKVEEQRKQFGCESLSLEVAGGVAKGELRCSQQVGRLTVSGTVKALGR